MADFELSKNVDEILEGELLPVEMYVMRITDEPIEEDSWKRKQGASDEEGGGRQIVLKLRVVDEKNPKFNGRFFKKNLPLVNEADKLASPNPITGQSRIDEKATRLVQWHVAFNGGVVPKKAKVRFEVGAEARVPVTIGPDFFDPEKESNQIDYNGVPEPL